jgi:uncharacterized membrane protein HdeD (DUF308 family)
MKKYDLIASVGLFTLGIILLFIPGGTITTILRIVGILIALFGGYIIYNSTKTNKNELVYGILIALLGIVFIASPDTIAGIIPFILGLIMIINSIAKLQLLSTSMNNDKKNFMIPMLANVIMLILGIILVINPFSGAKAMIRIIGIFLIVFSSLDVLEFYMTKPKKVKVIK